MTAANLRVELFNKHQFVLCATGVSVDFRGYPEVIGLGV